MEILTLGEKIRRKRKSLRLTLKDVAGNNVTPAQLSYVESNKCKPSTSLLKYICDKIALDISYVLETESEQAQKYCDYYLKEYEFYIKRGDYKESTNRLLKVEALAQEYNLDNYIGIVAFNRGITSLAIKDYNSAEYNLLSAMQLFMKLDNKEFLANCYYNLGLVSFNRCFISNALKYFNRATEILNNEFSDREVVHKIFIYKAKIYYEMGDIRKYKYNLSCAILKAREINDELSTAELLKEAVLMMNNPSELLECDNYIEEATNIYINAGYSKKVITLNAIKAMIHIKIGDCKYGTSLVEKILQDIDGQHIHEKDLFTYLLRTAYILLSNRNDYWCERIVSNLDNQVLNTEQKVIYLFLKSQIYKETDSIKFQKYLLETEKYIDKLKDKRMLLAINTALGEQYKLVKKYDEALKYFTNCAKLLQSENSLQFNPVNSESLIYKHK